MGCAPDDSLGGTHGGTLEGTLGGILGGTHGGTIGGTLGGTHGTIIFIKVSKIKIQNWQKFKRIILYALFFGFS